MSLLIVLTNLYHYSQIKVGLWDTDICFVIFGVLHGYQLSCEVFQTGDVTVIDKLQNRRLIEHWTLLKINIFVKKEFIFWVGGWAF